MRSDNDRNTGATPMMQKLFDSPFLLLIAGVVVMFVLFTGWGMIEILNLPSATLP